MPLEETMIKIQIDGTYYDVKPGTNVLEACQALGLDVPYFCFHPALGSVGACRLCAVKKYASADDKKGTIVMACMEPLKDGLIISVDDPEVKAFRAAVIEGLMTNHPHDCPVCDEGGECHLQDMTVMSGHNYRRFTFRKRTHNNQYLGPFIQHEMNRCIQCYRCVRFYRDYAGGKDFDVFGANNRVYFGRYEDGILENEFSGNLVEVCPTGVFTDKTLKSHYSRKWDLTHTPSLCVHCSVGCNIIASERYDYLRRIISRYHGRVNGYFICDRGRFGYEFVNDKQRLRKIMVRETKTGKLKETDHDTLTTVLKQALVHDRKIIGIGSPRASLESNFALSVLTGMENFYHGLGANDFNLVKTALHILNNGPAHTPSLKEMEQADAVFIVGEDVTHTAPMVALALRQAALNKPSEKVTEMGIPLWHDRARRDVIQDMKSPCFIATPYPTKLDDIALETCRAAPDDIAVLAFAVAHILDGKAPAPEQTDKETAELAQTIATALKEARHPLIVTGIHSGCAALLQASANVAWALASLGKTVNLSMLLPECNSTGLGMMGGGTLEDAAEVIQNSEDVTVIILENELFRRAGEKTVGRILHKAGRVIVLDHLLNATARKADVLLPAGTFAEAEGTLVSSEGRAQRFYRVFPLTGPVQESWRWIGEMIKVRDDKEQVPWPDFDSVVSAMTSALPVFTAIRGHFPDAAFRVVNEKIPRQTLRYSGRTAIHAAVNVSEPKPPGDTDSPLAFSMEGNSDHTPSPLIAFYWTPGWNSIQAVNKYLEEPAGALKEGNPGVRLIETTSDRRFTYYPVKSSLFRPRQGEWLLVAAHRIFGSEELSAQSPAIAERIPARFIMVNSEEASQAGFKDDEEVHLIVDDTTLKLKLKTSPDVALGVAAVGFNLPGMPWLPLPGWGKIIKINTEK